MYAPRAKYTSTKNGNQSSTAGNKHTTPKNSTTPANATTKPTKLTKAAITTTASKMTTKGLYSRRHFERYDKGSLSNKIVVKSLIHRVGGKRKTGANFITFKE